MKKMLCLLTACLYSISAFAYPMGGGSGFKSKGEAKDTTVSTVHFSKNLSSTDTDVQHALETLDQLSSGGTPGGSNTQVQYNNSSAFGGITGATSDGTNLLVTTQAALDNSTKVATTAYVDTAASVLVPSGTIVPYAGQTSPTGWLLCNGQAVSRSTYSALLTATTFTKTANLTSGNATATSVADTQAINYGMPIEGTGVAASVTFTATITAASSSMTSVSNTTGISAGMLIYDAAGNLPTNCYVRSISGTTITLGIYAPTMSNASLNARPAILNNVFLSQITKAGNTYVAKPAVFTTITLNTSFVMSNTAASTQTPSTITFFPYGNGDASTTFNVPDLRGRFPMGSGQNFSNNGTSSSTQYSTNIATGLISDFFVKNSGDSLSSGAQVTTGEDKDLVLGSFTTIPSFLALNWIIKT